MPNKDGTGPLGEGPKTGRGLGSCEGGQMRKRPNLGKKLGQGRGYGRNATNDKQTGQ